MKIRTYRKRGLPPIVSGIVADSVPDSEWTGMQNKARAAEMVLAGLDA